MVAAEASFNKILATNANDPFANLNMGLVKAQTGRRDEAISHYQIAIANGEGVQAAEKLLPGAGGEPYSGTVADLARQNLQNLGV